MAVDQYGSYTNNPLIYEAITGNTTDAVGDNTLLPLNTPIIDASIIGVFKGNNVLSPVASVVLPVIASYINGLLV